MKIKNKEAQNSSSDVSKSLEALKLKVVKLVHQPSHQDTMLAVNVSVNHWYAPGGHLLTLNRA